MADARLITSKAARGARKLARPKFTTDDLVAGRVRRADFESEIERLISVLDESDPDPDLEETGDLEPSLGAYRPGDAYDAEQDTGDAEPSLGSFDRMINQEKSYRVTAGSTWHQGHDFELDQVRL